MSEENRQDAARRKRRVQRLKKMIILLLLTLITIPIVCCVILFDQVGRLNIRLGEMGSQVEQLTQILLEQQQWMEEIGSGQGELLTGQASLEGVSVEALEAGDKAAESALPQTHKVYLTFDDGPSAYTNEILDILDRYEVKATFFVVGKEDEASREALRRIAEEGHTVGLHSYSHKYSDVYWSLDHFARDLEKLQDYVYQVTGQESLFYRFPGGSSNTVSNIDLEECAAYLREKGITYFDWNVSSGDGGSGKLTVEELVENATKGIASRETSIILLHDAKEKTTTVEALPIIIENILAMEDAVILPITEDTEPVQHLQSE